MTLIPARTSCGSVASARWDPSKVAVAMPPDLYTATEREKIVRGYQRLVGLADLLKDTSMCRMPRGAPRLDVAS